MDDLDMCTINSVVQDAKTRESQVKTRTFLTQRKNPRGVVLGSSFMHET